jgi:hypothetical protein
MILKRDDNKLLRCKLSNRETKKSISCHGMCNKRYVVVISKWSPHEAIEIVTSNSDVSYPQPDQDEMPMRCKNMPIMKSQTEYKIDYFNKYKYCTTYLIK